MATDCLSVRRQKMPDLFAHFMSGYLPTRYSKTRRYDALFIFGAMLPDIVTRIPEILFYRFFHFPVYDFLEALHTPISLIIICYLLSFLFEEIERWKSFLFLFLGSLLHITLDLMQEQFFHATYMPLFPLSFDTFQWKLFDYNDSMRIFPILLIVWLSLRIILLLRSRHR